MMSVERFIINNPYLFFGLFLIFFLPALIAAFFECKREGNFYGTVFKQAQPLLFRVWLVFWGFVVLAVLLVWVVCAVLAVMAWRGR